MKVVIADDYRLLRESFKSIIENNSDIEVVACAANGREAFVCCSKYKPDLLLMDIAMPVCNGIEATKLIKAKYPEIKILILTASFDEINVSEALKTGADGYILKDVGKEELILSIQSTAIGLGIIQRELLNSFTVHNPPNEHNKNKTIDRDGIPITITERQLTIIKMIVEGYDNRQISASLFIAEGTVKNTISEIITKLQLKDRTQLAVFAIKNNLD
jgi:DNA-binding NarL/FixJ family response regulator